MYEFLRRSNRATKPGVGGFGVPPAIVPVRLNCPERAGQSSADRPRETEYAERGYCGASWQRVTMPKPSAANRLELPQCIRTRAKGIRANVRTVEEGLRLIDRELPQELRSQSRWTFAHALLNEAQRTRKKRDLLCAVRQLRQALSNEGWLVE